MASKENQEALEHLKTCLNENGSYYKNFTSSFQPFMADIGTLQKVIDNLELKDKALDKACGILSQESYNDSKPRYMCVDKEDIEKDILEQARKELENGK